MGKKVKNKNNTGVVQGATDHTQRVLRRVDVVGDFRFSQEGECATNTSASISNFKEY